MKVYTGENTGAGGQVIIVKEVSLLQSGSGTTKSYELPLKPSLKLFNHSPDGFQWGYQGSGCAQLALAILLDLTGDKESSVRIHQEFKRHFIATASKNLLITEPEIRDWIEAKS